MAPAKAGPEQTVRETKTRRQQGGQARVTRTMSQAPREQSCVSLSSRMTVCAAIGMGSNLGDRRGALQAAVEQVAGLVGTHLVKVSTLIETDPVGLLDQPRFLNGVMVVHTSLPASHLMGELLRIESVLGRDRSQGVRLGPRVIDLDLLLYGQERIDEPDLTVPHPRLHERLFVLQPLAEVLPEAMVPGRGIVRDLLAAAICESKSEAAGKEAEGHA